jgi:hypothetical protein
LKVFIGNLGSEGRAPQILKEMIETVGPEANDYVVLLWYTVFRSESGDTRCQGDLEQVEHHLGKTKETS